ncbi:MAG TPA: cytochrome D1 domain-containing protein [Pyrinomonadaceae bacterium]|nr:cytochrome D1 domain-containing protein [Pyrinomonadaceae bacterium]
MSGKTKFKVLFLLCFSIVIAWRNYVIVIGQTSKPVLVALNKNEGSLTIIDPKDMKVLGKVPTGDAPHEVVLSADGRTAFVANYGAQTPGSSLSVIDVEAKKELRRVDLSPLLRPHGLVESSGKIYFTSETNRLIGRYDPATNRVDWLMGTGQNATHMIVVTPDQKRIFTANIASDSVTAFEFQNIPPAPSKVMQIAVGKQPEAIDISPDGKEVWVGLNAEGAIDVIDTAAGKVIEKIRLGERPYRVKFSPDGKQVFATIPDTKEIIVIDSGTKKETRRIKLESVPLGIVFSKDGKTAFVSAVQNDFVLKIDLEKFETVGKAVTGQAPDGVALAGI